MSLLNPYFHQFDHDISSIELPEQFTYPFCYEPHPIAVFAVEQLQQLLSSVLPGDIEGKMFGVLVVQNEQGNLGFLSAFSGQMTSLSQQSGFVPLVFDVFKGQSIFEKDLEIINAINQEVSDKEAATSFKQLQISFEQARDQYQSQVGAKQAEMVTLKAQRKQRRAEAKQQMSEEAYQAFEKKLNGESIFLKKELLALKAHLNKDVSDAEGYLNAYLAGIEQLKKQRRKLSNRLQKKLFGQYLFANANGDEKNLNEIFIESGELPPSGTGDCAAPKLMQFAYQNNFKPIAMAEFWWGRSPKSQIRQHKKYYPACQSKCGPVLRHMLKGLDLEPHPLLVNKGADKHIEIVYQDNDIAVINKPEGLLSVPGKLVTDSVLTRMQAMFPDADGPLIVHRLDMSTSGLMVIALTKRANKRLQQQFIDRTVSKQYVALLAGHLEETSGEIKLPLRQDLDDRPRQMVCYELGKASHTIWQLMRHEGAFSRVLMEPKTGRTHQLRMHSAHTDGLAMPIVGDDLYGQKHERLHLHAMNLSFDHPVTGERVSFSKAPDF